MRFIEKKFVEVIFPGRITTLARSNRTGHHERKMKDVRYDDVMRRRYFRGSQQTSTVQKLF